MRRIRFMKIACIVAVFVATSVSSPAQTFTVLGTFDGAQGSSPNAVVEGTNGNLFGTTLFGGLGRNSNGGDGTIFEVTPAGSPVRFYRFCSVGKCADGKNPQAGLVLGADGNFYGTTMEAGSGADCTNRQGCGTLFQFTPAGNLTTLYNFCSMTACSDGQFPQEPLVQGTNGHFYGTTFDGGSHTSSACGAAGCGTIFEITLGGSLTTLYSFCKTDCSDGAHPQAPLVLGNDGNFYGGANAAYPNLGTLFVMTPDGKFTTLHQFKSANGGDEPVGLVAGSDGNIYGTTAAGGSGANCTSQEICGTFFQLTPSGQFTTLYNFCSLANCADGNGPYIGGIIQGTDGNFYGTTAFGGTGKENNLCPVACGVLFQITPAGQLTVLYNFCSQANCADGNGGGALMQATDGRFYGTSPSGGLAGECGGNGCGTLFSLDMGLSPFVKANPVFGKAGNKINILGNNLTGTTSVAFNGVSAVFSVVSSTLIKATVPSGATTGTIEVTMPSGTLKSNLAFRVIP